MTASQPGGGVGRMKVNVSRHLASISRVTAHSLGVLSLDMFVEEGWRGIEGGERKTARRVRGGGLGHVF